MNWSGLAVPNNEDVTFDGTNTDDCDWDITNTQTSVTATSAYAANITCTAAGDFGNFTFDATGTFDGNGQNLTFDSIDASGTATKTIDMGDGSWTCGGNANFNGANLTLIQPAPTGLGLRLTATSTLSLVAGQEFHTVNFDGGITITLGTDVSTGDFTHTGAGAGLTLDANTLHITGALSTGQNITGTAALSFDGGAGGTSQQINVVSGATVDNDITINKSVPFTLTGTIKHTGDLTWIAGTVDPLTSSWQLTGTAQTYDTAGMSFYDIVPSPGLTLTLTTDINISHELTLPNSGATAVTINGNDINLSGDLNAPSGSNNNLEGTAVLKFTGSASQQWVGPDTAEIVNPIVIDKSGGTLTINGVRIAGNFTYISGTVDASAGGMFLVGTLNFAPGAIAIVTVVARDGGVATLTSDLTVANISSEAGSSIDFGANTVNVTGTVQITGGGAIDFGTSTVVYSGAACETSGNLDFHNLRINSGATLTIPETDTLTVAGLFYSRGTIQSNTPTVQATFTVNGTQNVANTTATDIDSSGGAEVVDYNGTLDNATNWIAPVVVVAANTDGALQFGGFPRFPSFQRGAR